MIESQSLNEEIIEYLEERAAIMEHDGGLSREVAEKYAILFSKNRFQLKHSEQEIRQLVGWR